MTWSLAIFEGEVLGYQIGAAWRKMDRTMDLYVMAIVSDCWPHVVPARAFRMFKRGVARVTILEIWWPKVKWGSRVTPSRRGCLSRSIRKEARVCRRPGFQEAGCSTGVERGSKSEGSFQKG